MIYKIKNNRLVKSSEIFDINKDNTILIVNSEEFSELENLYDELKIYRRSKTYNCTQIEIHTDYIYSAFYVPSKINAQKRNSFDCIVFKKRIILIDDSDYTDKIVNNIFNRDERKSYDLGKFFYELLSEIIFKDLIFLDSFDEKLYKIENDIINNNFDKFNSKLSEVKRHLLVYYRHYSQLLALCDSINEMEEEFFDYETRRLLSLYSQRVERLKDETALLREYTLQIQDMYQSQIGVKQNDIMKTLTIVTTIVLPLSLLAGWYGMNFKYMPELAMRYSYYVVIAVSVVIVAASLIVFKIKKYF